MTRAMLVDKLADLLADILVADYKQFPTLPEAPESVETGVVARVGHAPADSRRKRVVATSTLRIVRA